jgi:hypothetical protein
MVQFVSLLDANGTVLEINHVALDAVGIKLSDLEGCPPGNSLRVRLDSRRIRRIDASYHSRPRHVFRPIGFRRVGTDGPPGSVGVRYK